MRTKGLERRQCREPSLRCEGGSEVRARKGAGADGQTCRRRDKNTAGTKGRWHGSRMSSDREMRKKLREENQENPWFLVLETKES